MHDDRTPSERRSLDASYHRPNIVMMNDDNNTMYTTNTAGLTESVLATPRIKTDDAVNGFDTVAGAMLKGHCGTCVWCLFGFGGGDTFLGGALVLHVPV